MSARTRVRSIYVPGSHRPTPRRLAWERRVSLTARAQPGFSVRARLAADHARDAAPSRLWRAPGVRGAGATRLVVADTMGFHARGIAARPSAACRNLGLRPPQSVSAVAGTGPRRHAAGQGSCRAALLVGDGPLASGCGSRRNPWRPAGSVTALSPPDHRPGLRTIALRRPPVLTASPASDRRLPRRAHLRRRSSAVDMLSASSTRTNETGLIYA